MKNVICLLICFCFMLSITACGAADETEALIVTDENISDNESGEITDFEEDDENTVTSKQKNSSGKGNSSKKNNGNKYSSGKSKNSSKKASSLKSANTSSGVRYPKEQKIITIRKANQDSFKKIGRWDTEGYKLGISLNWSCSSVEFNVDCKDDLAIQFQKGGGTSPLFMKIYVDGKAIEERTKIEKSGELTIATGLQPGVHNVKIVRQSDVECPTFTLLKILAKGKLADPPKENPIYIEAIGDASLIGWGVKLEDSFFDDFYANTKEKQSIARNKENQDGTLAYPYVAAEKLGADLYVLARQGAGIAATYHKNSEGYCNPRAGLLPTMHQYMHTSGNKLYEAERTPDVFVIDAGAADLNSSLQKIVKDGDNIGINTVRATEISVGFLKQLKSINPNAKIIWCYGLTKDITKNKSLEDYILKIVAQVKGVYALKLPLSKRGEYPSVSEHAAAATLLANKIKQVIK